MHNMITYAYFNPLSEIEYHDAWLINEWRNKQFVWYLKL